MASDYTFYGVDPSPAEGYWVEAGVTSYFVPTGASAVPSQADLDAAAAAEARYNASLDSWPAYYAVAGAGRFPNVASVLMYAELLGVTPRQTLAWQEAWRAPLAGVPNPYGEFLPYYEARDFLYAFAPQLTPEKVNEYATKVQQGYQVTRDIIYNEIQAQQDAQSAKALKTFTTLLTLAVGGGAAIGAMGAGAFAGDIAAASALSLEAPAEAAFLSEAAAFGSSELTALGAETIGAADMGMGQFDFLDVSGYADAIDPSFVDFGDFADVGFDPGFDPSIDFGSLDTGIDLPADQIDWGADFSTDPLQGADVGLDPWGDLLQTDTGNFGLDVPEMSVQEVADATGANVAEVSNLQMQFPDVSMNDVFSYAKRGMDLFRAFTSAQQAPITRPKTTATRTVYDPRTGKYVQQPVSTGLTSTTPQRRTVTDPRTGQPVTVQWNAQTGKWEPVSEWIAGVPNWAVIAGGGAALLLLFARKRK